MNWKNISVLYVVLTASFLISSQARGGYDPTIGRWLSRDPMNNAEIRQGPNLYSYVGSDPINLTDPLGLYTEVITFAPVGHGKSSFGHTAVNINGTIYSFGERGWYMDSYRPVYEVKWIPLGYRTSVSNKPGKRASIGRPNRARHRAKSAMGFEQ